MSHYWAFGVPGSTVSSSDAERIAVFARNMQDTSVAQKIAAASSKLAPLCTQLASVTVATNLGKIPSSGTAGAVVATNLIISSGVGDPVSVIDITISPSTGSTKVVGTTAGSTAVVGAALSDSGLILVKGLTSTGGSVTRYIKLFST